MFTNFIGDCNHKMLIVAIHILATINVNKKTRFDNMILYHCRFFNPPPGVFTKYDFYKFHKVVYCRTLFRRGRDENIYATLYKIYSRHCVPNVIRIGHVM